MPRPQDNKPTPVSSDQLKETISGLSKDAQRYAQIGPKKSEDECHFGIDVLLDRLEKRGDL